MDLFFLSIPSSFEKEGSLLDIYVIRISFSQRTLGPNKVWVKNCHKCARTGSLEWPLICFKLHCALLQSSRCNQCGVTPRPGRLATLSRWMAVFEMIQHQSKLNFLCLFLWQLEKKWLLRQTLPWLLSQIGHATKFDRPPVSRFCHRSIFNSTPLSLNTLWVSIWAATDNDAECLDWSPLHRSQLRTPDTDNTWLILITPDSLTHIKSLFNMAYVKMFFC